MRKSLCILALAILAGQLLGASPASAHPHVWVTMKSELIYAPDGQVTAIRHTWTFDDMFSAFAIQGIENKTKGVFTREELHPLAQTNVDSLKEFDYFTVAKVNGKRVAFHDPSPGYYLEYDDEILTLHFTLPLANPVRTQDLQIEIYDPSFFVDFSFDRANPVSLEGAPAACKLSLRRPEEMDPATAARLFQLPPDAKLDPGQYLGEQFANRIVVKCP